MKLGDLVRWVHPEVCDEDLGVIVEFDRDNDPVILWQSEGFVGKCGEYRSQVEVVNYESW